MLFLIFDNNFWDLIRNPPGSMIFVFFIALATALISTLLMRWLIDTDELARKQKRIKAHQEEKEKIIELVEVDLERYRKLRKKWERKDVMFKKTQQGISLQRIKPSCIRFLPMIIIFSVLNIMLFAGSPVALSAMHANDIPLIGNFISAGPLWINFTAWYSLCSLGLSTLIQRLLKLETQASGGMEQMLGASKVKALEFPEV